MCSEGNTAGHKNNPEISGTGKDNLFTAVLDKPTEKMGRAEMIRKQNQFHDESCSDKKVVE